MSAYYSTTHNDPPPPQHSSHPHGSLHQSSFHNLTLEHSLEDLSARFIVNLPAEELESMDRVCFQIEQAHWYYEDFIRPAALNPGLLPSYGLKAFSLLMFRSCPLLHDLLPNHSKIWNSFMAYKERVPVCGAIIISEYWDKVLLVKGWTKGSSWSFPRGKINKEEPEAMCAVREVLEETGFDMTDYFHPSQFQPGHVEDEGSERIPYYVELVIKEQKIRLYFIPGVREDTVFETRTRKEISKIEWFKLNDLPTWSKDKKGRTTRTKAQLEGRQAKFYMVTPFISHLKLWIDHHKPKNLPPRPANELSPPANQLSPLPSPSLNDLEYEDDLHDDPTYHLPSEIELGDSTSAEADSTEDELDDFLQPTTSTSETVSFETTQQGTEALTALFFGSPPPTTSAPLPLSPPTRSQSFEVASTPPHIAYERQSSFVQPKPQNAMTQQTKLLELLSGAVPSPPPPPPPQAPQYQQNQYPQQPRNNPTESRSLLHLLNDVNLSANSPTTPQDSTPQHSSPAQQPHSILFSGSQAPPEAREFGQPLPAHLQPDRNDNERKEKHNALLRALLSVATRPTPPQDHQMQMHADGMDSPLTPTTPGNMDSREWSRETSQERRMSLPGTAVGVGARSADVGKNGEPYGPDEDEEVWPPRVLRRNQLYPLETPQLPEIIPQIPPSSSFSHQQPYPAAIPERSQFPGQQSKPNGGVGGGGSLLSILNGPGGERAPPQQQTMPSPQSESRGKDPLELLREHRARQLGQDPRAEPSQPLPPVVPQPTISSQPPLPVPPTLPNSLSQPQTSHPPLQQPQYSAPQQYPGMQPHYYLPPPHSFPVVARPAPPPPFSQQQQQQQPNPYPQTQFVPPYPPSQRQQPFVQHSFPSAPLPPHPQQIRQNNPPLQNSTHFPPPPPGAQLSSSSNQNSFPPLPTSQTTTVTATAPPRPTQNQQSQPLPQTVPSMLEFPPLGAAPPPTTKSVAGTGMMPKSNAGALLGLFNAKN
ncbi:hypothetical protein JCM3765_000971 [Sporobolomyces pararoseus]